MNGVLNLTRWEWYKLRHRWMPWILLGITLAYTQALLWGAFTLHHLAGIGAIEVFALPGSITLGLGLVHPLTIFLAIILASSTTGAEYAWGTLRPALSKGPGRWEWLASQGLLLSLLAIAALLLVCLGIAFSSLIATAFTPGTREDLAGSPGWTSAVAVLAKQLFALAPWIALAVFFTVLTTSSRLGGAFAVGYYLGEQLLVSIVSFVYDDFQKVSQFMLGPNVDAWLSSDTGMDANIGGIPLLVGEGPDPLRAFLVIAAYILVLAGATLWLFQKRDITGPRGG
jgi:ABC-type transport system involved in multi-copper enzyme maturation permease subunit